MPSESDVRFNWVNADLATLDASEARELVVDAWRMVVAITGLDSSIRVGPSGPRGESLAPVGNARSEYDRHGYDDRMKRITVSLPDDLVDKIKRAAGGDGQVSAYVATALEDYQERESLDQILASWAAETPESEDVRRRVSAELDSVGLPARPARRRRTG